MKIWHLYYVSNDYDSLIPAVPFTVDDRRSFDGRSKKETWHCLPVKRMEPEKKPKLTDAPGWEFPIFSKRAMEVLRPLIHNSIEELELQFDEGEYVGINVTAVLDVIDYSKSEYKMFSSGTRIMCFEKYAFRVCDDLINNHIFKIVDEPIRRPFVSDYFKDVVEKNNLTGFKFKLLWDSDLE